MVTGQGQGQGQGGQGIGNLLFMKYNVLIALKIMIKSKYIKKKSNINSTKKQLLLTTKCGYFL